MTETEERELHHFEVEQENAALKAAAIRYVKAVQAIHVVHPNTDVHNHGGVAGQAITPHCAWECPISGGRVEVNEDGSISVIEGPAPHKKELDELSASYVNLLDVIYG